jgi:ABC-type transporter Mla MlaB component
MPSSTFAQSDFGASQQGRNSLLRRVGLFVKKPYLDWVHTQTPLDPEDEQRLRQQFISKRDRNLTGRESERDLHELRSKISRNRADAERIDNGGALSKASKLALLQQERAQQEAEHDSIASRPRAMQSTLQHNEVKTLPMKFEGSIFTLSAHVASSDGFEVRTLEAGDLEACLDEAAYSFSSGDEISAEAVLLQACEDFKGNAADIYPYLLDLYRITVQTQPYAAAASLYSRASNVPIGMLSVVREQARVAIQSTASWTLSPVHVTEMDMAFQNERNGGEPCEYRFDGVTHVAHEALKPLGQLLDRIASTPHEFAFSGLSALINALEKQSKEMLSSQLSELHRARFCAARLAGNIQLFEEAARDFGNAERIPAPSWRAPRCMLLVPVPQQHTNRAIKSSNSGHLHFALVGTLTRAMLQAELQIQSSNLAHSNTIHVDCSALHSISFDAAAALVDWLRAASSVGAKVSLNGLHRLCERLLLSIGAEKKWLVLSHPYA